MKKAILTIGLFSLMMVLTSFTSPEIGGGGNQGAPQPPRGISYIGGNQGAPQPSRSISDIGGGGNQGAPQPPRSISDIGGTQGAPRNR